MPPMRRDPNRGRMRAREACQNCRKKKARCPSEKPACSSCVRLNQFCVYEGTRPPDRLTDLEKKVDLILNCGEQRRASDHLDDGGSTRQQPAANIEVPATHHHNHQPLGDLENSSQPQFHIQKSYIPEPAVVHALDVYFERVHRQPIWCFNRQDLGYNTEISKELIYSVLELTARFSWDRNHEPQHFGESAKWSIMLRVANDTVELETIESFCLLSYSAFIGKPLWIPFLCARVDFEKMVICTLASFTLALGFQLCRSAKLDRPHNEDLTAERGKRLIWSFQTLEQFYSGQHGFLRTTTEGWRPYYLSESGNTVFPRDAAGSTDIGIWSHSLHFGWVWSRVREYVFECSRNKLIEPWRLDSTYAKVLADMTEIENMVPLCHRYDKVRFYERRPDEVQRDRDYWMPWLKLQFTWHSILTLINHPFLYIVASQYHPNLAIPNTFWRKSSELVLLHATWIVRTIDMTYEKKIKLLDPFLGHAAAIAATVHLYFCCAADSRLRQKSKTDFAKCRKFLKGFSSFSPACERLARLLDKLSRIALGSENMDEWTLSRVRLRIPLMWAVLQFEIFSPKAASSPSDMLPTSPTLSGTVEEMEQSQTLEINDATTPPTVIIDPSQGHDARLPPYKASSASPKFPNGVMRDIIVPPAGSFMFNTPWLWTDPSEYANTEDVARFPTDFTDSNTSEGFSTWWNFGNL